MQLPELVDVFEKMCEIPIDGVCKEDDISLFETGTYEFTGEPMFNFSMTRQYPDGNDEYFQIRLVVLYKPSDKNKHLECTEWSNFINEDFCDFIRNSKEYNIMKDEQIANIEIYLDQT